MILYIENPKEPIEKISEPINKFSKISWYKINNRNQLYFYILAMSILKMKSRKQFHLQYHLENQIFRQILTE